MWHDDNDDIMKLYDIIENHNIDSPLPANCPICVMKAEMLFGMAERSLVHQWAGFYLTISLTI